jgi:hypothetical protein
MTDLRAEATRIGYWDEGVGAWASGQLPHPREYDLAAIASSLMSRGIITPEREDAHIDDCD